jgi:hypothetical protein
MGLKNLLTNWIMRLSWAMKKRGECCRKSWKENEIIFIVQTSLTCVAPFPSPYPLEWNCHKILCELSSNSVLERMWSGCRILVFSVWLSPFQIAILRIELSIFNFPDLRIGLWVFALLKSSEMIYMGLLRAVHRKWLIGNSDSFQMFVSWAGNLS